MKNDEEQILIGILIRYKPNVIGRNLNSYRAMRWQWNQIVKAINESGLIKQDIFKIGEIK